MYYVYLDNELIHDMSTGLILQSPTAELAENTAGSFSFGVTADNPAYRKLKDKIVKGHVKLTWENEVLFEGRIMDVTQDFLQTFSVRCEGVMAYLADTIQRAQRYSKQTISGYLQTLLNSHNSQVEDEKKIYLGKVEVADRLGSRDYITDYRSTWDTIQSDLIDRHGGFITVTRGSSNRLVLDYLKEYPRTSSQAVEFADNLLNFTENVTGVDLATRCIPLGEKIDSEDQNLQLYTTIADVNGGEDYVELPEAVKRYGTITKVVNYDGVTDKNLLKTLGQEWLTAWQYAMLTLTLTAADLADFGLEKDHLRLLDKVHCLSQPHGMDVWLPITEVVFCITDPSRNTYTIGNKPRALSERLLREQDDLKTQLNGKTDPDQAADIAQKYDTIIVDKNRQEVHEALLKANEFTESELKGYMTAVETQTKIEATEQKIELSVIQQGNVLRDDMDKKLLPYATEAKLETQAKAIKASVQETLGNYYLKTAVDMKVDGLTAKVSSKLDKGEMWTQIDQSPDKLKVAWNNISKYVSIENASFVIYESGTQKKAAFDSEGIKLYQGGVLTTTIGEQAMVPVLSDNSSHTYSRGAVLVGESNANYVGLGGKQSGVPYLRFFYAINAFGNFTKNCLHAGCSLDMHEGNIYNVRITGKNTNNRNSMVQYSNVCDSDITNCKFSGGTMHGITLDNCTIKSNCSIPNTGGGGTTIVQGLQGTGWNGNAGINYYLLTGWSYRKYDSRNDYVDATKITGYQKVVIKNGLLDKAGPPQGTSN